MWRKDFSAHSHCGLVEVDVILTDLARHAIVLPVPTSVDAPLAADPGDQFLWNLLTIRDDLMLVTGDKLLQQAGPLQQRGMTPQAFVAQVLD